jgi:hypothetical protein
VTLSFVLAARWPVFAVSEVIPRLDAASLRIIRNSRRKAMPVAVR